MEMRATEDTAIGQDLTPPLPPLAFVLRDSAVSSHCAACTAALPPQPCSPFSPTSPENPCHVPSNTPTSLYCSPPCSSLDSPLHFSSAEGQLLSLFRQSAPPTWPDSTDLRLSLRLICMFQAKKYSVLPRIPASGEQRLLLGGNNNYPFQENENLESPNDDPENKDEVFERIGGLMTNREKLVFQGSDQRVNHPDEKLENFEDSDEDTKNLSEKIREGAKLMAMARRVCVENQEEFVLEESVLCLVLTNAVEVQDKSGRSIGLAVYGSSFSWINHSCSPNACYQFLVGQEHYEQSPLRVTSAGNEYRDDLIMDGDLLERNGYGPRLAVRSIKAVKKGEEVTIAYTDLLQPKEMRRAELCLNYQFICSCKRCSAVPSTYVDDALQALSPDNPDNPESPDNKIEQLKQIFDDAITDYLSLNDPKSCCKKLEDLLSQNLKLHPFHYLSINAYTTLASAYKVHANFLALNDEPAREKLEEAINMYKTSAAYSLLLAGVVNHLFTFESALVENSAIYFINAGESMLRLSRSFLWSSPAGPTSLELSSFLIHKRCDCCLGDSLEQNIMQFEEIESRVYNCITSIAPKVWGVLASDSTSFLKLIQNPVDFSWLASLETSTIAKDRSFRLGAGEYDVQFRKNLVLLSIHCLRYGSFLSSICNGLSVEMNYERSLAFLKEGG